uniref:Butyrophilin subfamily 1 member A1-like n=1 Tax=Sphenodon punctatus TaxID=8508 RepID=A0A8D0G571_SPHPU
MGPSHPIMALVGEDVVLPCHLSPSLSAENMEVRWFLSEFSSTIHLYRDGKDHSEYQIPGYEGRTEFLREDITNGSIALRIRDIRPSDEGQYGCFFQSITFYAQALSELKVAGLGSSPLISVKGYQDGGIHLVCQSAGWYPEPEVLWRDPSGKHLPSLSEAKSQGTNDLFDMEYSIILQENTNQNLSCWIKNPRLNQAKESVIYISDPFFPKGNPWKLTLAFLLPVSFILFVSTIYLFSVKGKWKRKIGKLTFVIENLTEKNGELQAAVEKLDLENRWRRFVTPIEQANVTLDPKTAHPQLSMSEDRKSVTMGSQRQDLPDNPERFLARFCVLGYEGFTSGRHYWEVELGEGRFWAVGVARESVKRKGRDNFSPEDGVWALWQWDGQYKALTSPETPLTLSSFPKRIRVSLNYAEGQVVFFDADTIDPIFTFTQASFAGERVLPWLWMWPGSQLRLCN